MNSLAWLYRVYVSVCTRRHMYSMKFSALKFEACLMSLNLTEVFHWRHQKHLVFVFFALKLTWFIHIKYLYIFENFEAH